MYLGEKNLNFFSAGYFFCVLKMNVYRRTLFATNLCFDKFLVARQYLRSSSIIFHVLIFHFSSTFKPQRMIRNYFLINCGVYKIAYNLNDICFVLNQQYSVENSFLGIMNQHICIAEEWFALLQFRIMPNI